MLLEMAKGDNRAIVSPHGEFAFALRQWSLEGAELRSEKKVLYFKEKPPAVHGGQPMGSSGA